MLLGEKTTRLRSRLVRSVFNINWVPWTYHHNHRKPFTVLGNFLLEDAYLVVFKAELCFKLDVQTDLSVVVRSILEYLSRQLGYVKLQTYLSDIIITPFCQVLKSHLQRFQLVEDVLDCRKGPIFVG